MAMLGWACAAPIHAFESGYGLGLSLAHDSNIARVETNPQNEWTRALIFGVFLRENNEDVTARVLAQVERRHFYRHTFSDDTGGFLDGAAVWTILRRQFTWAVQDMFQEVRRNIAAPSTPSNFTKANSLSTGPDFTFPFSSTNSAVIGGRYGRFDVRDSIHDNRRYTGYVRGVHASSPQAELSLNYEATRAYFEPGAQISPKILREDWFGRYENRSVINTTAIDIGTSRITQYGGGPALQCQVASAATPFPSPCIASASSLEPSRLVRLTFSQALSSQSTLRLALADQVADTHTDLIAGATSSTAPRDTGVVVFSGSNSVSGDLYNSKRSELAYTNDDGRFGYTLQGYGRRVDFETLDQSYQEKGGTFLWTWIYSSDMRFRASTVYTKRTFPSLDRQDSDRTYGMSGTYGLNSRTTLTVNLGRFARQSTAPLSSYVDNQVTLILGYSSGFTDVRSRR